MLPWRMGMLKSRSWESWLLVALLVVSTTGASPMTERDSESPPSFRVMSAIASRLTFTTMLSCRRGAKPVICVCTE